MKACGCGLRFSLETWSALPLLGYQEIPADETGPAERLELKNCPCGSTIAIEAEAA